MSASVDYLSEIMAKTTHSPVVVVGDAMIDIYTRGAASRMMPEDETAPVLLAERITAILGGAANVAANLASLDIPVTFLCLTGNDAARQTLIDLAHKAGINSDSFIIDASRPTTTKNRLMIENRFLGRVDEEKTHDVEGQARAELIARYEAALSTAKAVILSDYCKGCLPGDVIRSFIEKAAEKNIPVFVDSKKKDLSVFNGAFLVKPNKKELTERTSETDAQKAGRLLINQTGITHILASRSEEGVCLISAGSYHAFPATARKVREVSGAGDTMMAVTAAAYAAGAAIEDAAWLGNLAAGAAVEKEHTSILKQDELLEAITRHHPERRSA